MYHVTDYPPALKRHGAAERIKASAKDAAQNASHSQALSTMSLFSGLAGVLRISGALAVIAAMSAFLLQDWSSGEDLDRFYLLLSQTLILACAGLSMSYLIKENKGARVFFGLSVLSITVNMATLGALIFSTVQWGSDLAVYPSYVRWQLDNPNDIALALGGILLVSMPVAWFSYMVFARNSAKLLAALCVFTNLLLLVPVRESLEFGALVAIAALVPIFCISHFGRKDAALRTSEGLFAIATIFAPAILMICRSLMLYPIDDNLQFLFAIIGYIGVRQIADYTELHSRIRTIINIGSLALAVIIAAMLPEIIALELPNSVMLSLFSGCFTLLLLDISKRSKNPIEIAHIASLVLAVVHIGGLLEGVDRYLPMLSIFVGVSIMFLGRHFASRFIQFVGASTIIAGIGAQGYDLIFLIDFTNWMTLAAFGASAIVIGSLLERHGAVLLHKWNTPKKAN
ncbi:MAG: hypothetical protein MK052_08745 [Alphaproteobacteria bacterium]|nr:hypothetical protein [Alphaproteobacteria bacterium]